MVAVAAASSLLPAAEWPCWRLLPSRNGRWAIGHFVRTGGIFSRCLVKLRVRELELDTSFMGELLGRKAEEW